MAKTVGDKIRCPDCGAECTVNENKKKGLFYKCAACGAWGGVSRNGKPTTTPGPGASAEKPADAATAADSGTGEATNDVAWYDRAIF